MCLLQQPCVIRLWLLVGCCTGAAREHVSSLVGAGWAALR
jgi:hypothetical protein